MRSRAMQQIVVVLTLSLLASATAACGAGTGGETEICEKQARCAGGGGLDDEAKKTFVAECSAKLDPVDLALCAACVAERSCSEIAEGACSSDCGPPMN